MATESGAPACHQWRGAAPVVATVREGKVREAGSAIDMPRRRFVRSIAACLGAGVLGRTPVVAQRESWRFPIRFHAPADGLAVVDDAWIAAQLGVANDLFGPFNVAFQAEQRIVLDPTLTRLDRIADDLALGMLLDPTRIDIFIVSFIRWGDSPASAAGKTCVLLDPNQRFIALSANAFPPAAVGDTVLAHELGHYFGNEHADVAGNIMQETICIRGSEGCIEPAFTAAQGVQIVGSAREFARRRRPASI
jgi:hypothetical protein